MILLIQNGVIVSIITFVHKDIAICDMYRKLCLYFVLLALQCQHKLRQFCKSKRINKVCAVLAVLMQYYNIADGKRMSLIICGVVNIELCIDCFQCFRLCLSLQFRQFSHIHELIIFRQYSIKIIFGYSHTLQAFRSFKAKLIQFRIILQLINAIFIGISIQKLCFPVGITL